jgi:hypothetical protein
MANIAKSQNIDIPGPYLWENRILLVFNLQNDDQLNKQLHLFSKNQAGMDERDLIVFRILPDKVEQIHGKKYGKNAAEKLRSKYNIDKNDFTVILIGKDGTEKLRQQKVLSIDKLFATIDAMPMRRREMRNSDGG